MSPVSSAVAASVPSVVIVMSVPTPVVMAMVTAPVDVRGERKSEGIRCVVAVTRWPRKRHEEVGTTRGTVKPAGFRMGIKAQGSRQYEKHDNEVVVHGYPPKFLCADFGKSQPKPRI